MSKCTDCTWDVSGNLLLQCVPCFMDDTKDLPTCTLSRKCECGARAAKTPHSHWCPAYVTRKQPVNG